MAERPRAKLYVIPGSHAARTGMLLLDHKGIDYRLVTLPTGFQRTLRLRGFPGGTVPALVVDGRRVQTNLAMARALDEVQPEPPLLPADPERRRAVEEVEHWVDEELQMVARRLVLAAALDWPGTLVDHGDDGRMGPLLWRRRWARRLGVRLPQRIFRVDRAAERELLDRLPALLDRVDEWVEAGAIGGEELTAADYAVASNVALLTYRGDLHEELRARPVMALVDRVLPAP
ncbi:MAG TPA: glutathione S-transferase family protein [Thermoleophilaceae bacterium]